MPENESAGNQHSEPADRELARPLPLANERSKSNTEHPGSHGDNASHDVGNSHLLTVHPLKHSVVDWLQLITNVGLLFVGIIYAIYAARQWQATRAAIELTKTSIELSRTGLELTRRQTEASERQAIAAEGGNALAGRALDFNRETAQAGQRPRLVIAALSFTSQIAAGSIPRAIMEIRNDGPGTAFGVATSSTLEMMTTFPGRETPDPPLDKELSGIIDMVSGQRMSYLANNDKGTPLSEADLSSLKSRVKRLIAFSHIKYKAADGHIGQIWICGYWREDQGSNMLLCPGNYNRTSP